MIKASIQGTRELIASLNELSRTKAKQAIRKGSRAAAKIVAEEARRTAPRKTGELARSFKVRSMARSRRYVGTRVTEVFPFAGFVEYGTKHSKPSHAVAVAFDNVKTQAERVFLETIKTVIEGQ